MEKAIDWFAESTGTPELRARWKQHYHIKIYRYSLRAKQKTKLQESKV
jgi:hypothetical protein